MGSVSETPVDRLLRILDTYRSPASADPSVMSVMEALAKAEPEIREAVRARRGFLKNRVDEVVQNNTKAVEDTNLTWTAGREEDPHYPAYSVHQWGAFAYLAIESGGYGDLDAVNPYNGDRLNVPVFHKDGKWYDIDPSVDIYTGLHRLVDAMEKTEFLGPKDKQDGTPA